MRSIARLVERGAANFARPSESDVIGNYFKGLLFTGSEDGLPDTRWIWLPTRAIVTPESSSIPKRLARQLRQSRFEVRFDHDFEAVMDVCRHSRPSTWITEEVLSVCRGLHSLGLVTTAGAYQNGNLVGGLWGFTIGRTFAIMSLFHTVDNAGNAAQVAVHERLIRGEWDLLDLGPLTENNRRFGAFAVPTESFLEMLLKQQRRSVEADPPTS